MSLLLLLACSAPPERSYLLGPGERPDVVVVVLDTLRADRGEAFGTMGVPFGEVVAPSSWTRPSVAAALTGQHPRTLGIARAETDALGPAWPALGRRFAEAGYTTFGATANPNLNRAFGFGRGFDAYIDSEALFAWMDGGDSGRTLVPAARIYERALEQAATPGPVYVQLDVMDVHEHARGEDSLTRPELRGRRATPYDDAVAQLALDTSTFVSAWSERRPDTFFVLFADHGEGLDDHPHVPRSTFHGRQLYRSQVAVPLVIFNPSREPALDRVDQRVRLEDVAPTVLGLAGLEVAKGLEGRSLAPLLKGEGGVPPVGPLLLETRFRGVERVGLLDGDRLYLEHRDGEEGVEASELHAWEGDQDGAATSLLPSAEADRLAPALSAAEAALPYQEAGGAVLSDEESERLRGLGYVE